MTPYHRVGSGTWDMMDRGSFNGPGGPHNRWLVPAQYGGSMGAEHTLRSQGRHGLRAQLARAARQPQRAGAVRPGGRGRGRAAVNAEPQPTGIRSGIQVFLDGAAPVDKDAGVRRQHQPAVRRRRAERLWTNYSLETVQRIGYGSFEPDNGVLITKNKAWAAGAIRGTEGSRAATTASRGSMTPTRRT